MAEENLAIGTTRNVGSSVPLHFLLAQMIFIWLKNCVCARAFARVSAAGAQHFILHIEHLFLIEATCSLPVLCVLCAVSSRQSHK